MTASLKTPLPTDAPTLQPPRPLFYKVLLALYIPPEKIGNVYTPEGFRREAKYSNIHGRVVALGPDAYTDTERWPTGAPCKVGDWVLFERTKAFAFNYFGTPYALVNEDNVDAEIQDPAELQLITFGDPSR